MLRLAAFVLLAGCATDHSETEVTVWSRLPGATLSVDGVIATLDTPAIVMRVRPEIRGTSAPARIDAAGEMIDLVLDWSRDYEVLRLPDDTALTAFTLLVLQTDDGSCVAGMTNVRPSEGGGWAADYAAPVSACGPFGLVRFRRDRRAGPCPSGSDCIGFEEIDADGTLRFDPYFGVPGGAVVERTLSSDERSRTLLALTDPALMDLLADERPCPPVSDISETMRLEWALESAENDVEACDARPLEALRALLDELVAARSP